MTNSNSNRKSKQAVDDEEVVDRYAFPFQAMLVCGVIIVIVGVVMTLVDVASNGFLSVSRYGNLIGGQGVSGPGAIIIGILVSVCPIMVLLRMRRRNRRGRA